MRILIIGSDGQLGSEFVHEYETRRMNTELCKATIKDFDITDYDKTSKFILDFSPNLIINCAGYTNVDAAEDDPDLAHNVNAIGSKNVALSANICDASVVYISTDYVFDGKKSSPYTEFDAPNPLNVYAKSKLAGEVFLGETANKFFIIRTSWLYGKYGSNFLKTILTLSKTKPEIRVVDDQTGTPTDTKSLVVQINKLIDRGIYGIYNAACNGYCSWHEFAVEIVKLAGLDTKVVPIKTHEYPMKAQRPKYSVLGNYMMSLDNIDIMPHWRDSLIRFFNENRVGELI